MSKTSRIVEEMNNVQAEIDYLFCLRDNSEMSGKEYDRIDRKIDWLEDVMSSLMDDMYDDD